MLRRSRRRSRGFFIIWGSKTFFSNESVPPVNTVCPACRQQTVLRGRSARTWFTLYFVIPVFPTSGVTRFTECSNCRAQFRGTIEEFRAATASVRSAATGFPAAIALYNEMREAPSDSAKLLRLMHMYIELGEPGEAISAAHTYLPALQASDQCLALLGTLFHQASRREDALRAITAALALNPHNAEAQRLQNQLLAPA